MEVDELTKAQVEWSGLDIQLGHVSQRREVEDEIIGK